MFREDEVILLEEVSAPLGDDDLRLIAETIPHIVWLADESGRTIYVNRRSTVLTGLPTERFVGQGWLDALHPEDRSRAERRLRHAVAGGVPYQDEYRVRRHDGRYRCVQSRGLPIRDRRGYIIRWIGTWTDIEELKQAVEQVRAAERRAAEALALTEAIMEGAPVVIGLLDRELRLVRMNGAMATLMGLSPDDLGRPLATSTPAGWVVDEEPFRRVLETGEPILDAEITRQHPTLGSWHGLIHYYPVSVDEEIVGVGLAALDITRRKRLEDLHTAILDNVDEGIFVIDADGRVTLLNRAAENLIGWSESEALGRRAHDLWHHQHGDGEPRRNGCEIELAGREGHTIRMEDTFTRKDGSLLPVAFSAAPIAGAGASSTVVAFHDATAETTAKSQARRELDALTWVGRVRDALQEDRFVLYSQPIIPLQRPGPPGAEELLIRMVGSSGNVILPGSFLGVAERFGLIAEIDRWVIGEAAKLARQGRRVEANLSAWTISNVDVLAIVAEAIDATGADPDRLVFEITETTLLRDTDAAERFASGLADLGCRLALDDFGTGYSGFAYLKRLPISYLKIDREFVRDLASTEANWRVVEAVVGLAKGLGYETVAEGVEDEETLSLLRAMGVDLAQGFHIGMPAPIDAGTNLTLW